jgi:putative peptidoglycan lipid II flippase
VSAALLYYAVGLWAFAGVRIVSQAFYALQDTKTPVKIAIVALFTNILLSAAFLAWTELAHGGLALAASLASMLNITLSTVFLRKKIGRMDGRKIGQSLLRIVPASIVMGVIGWWVSKQAVWSGTGNSLYKAELLGGTVAASVLFYVIVMWILRSEELKFMWEMVRRKKGSQGQGPGARDQGQGG